MTECDSGCMSELFSHSHVVLMLCAVVYLHFRNLLELLDDDFLKKLH